MSLEAPILSASAAEDLLFEAEELTERLGAARATPAALHRVLTRLLESPDQTTFDRWLKERGATNALEAALGPEMSRLRSSQHRSAAEIAWILGWTVRLLRARPQAAPAPRPFAPAAPRREEWGRGRRERPGQDRGRPGERQRERPGERAPAGGGRDRDSGRGPRGRDDRRPGRPEPGRSAPGRFAAPIAPARPAPAPLPPPPREKVWPQAILEWRKQDQVLVAIRDNARAERKLGADRSIADVLPENLRVRLFEKSKEVPRVRVVVKAIGSGYELVRIEGLAPADEAG